MSCLPWMFDFSILGGSGVGWDEEKTSHYFNIIVIISLHVPYVAVK